jgi:hypothetical protein
MDRKTADKVLSLTIIQSADDLIDILVELREEFEETGEFSTIEIAEIKNEIWPIVQGSFNELSYHIQRSSDHKACMGTACKFSEKYDESVMKIYIIWKGDDW